MKEIIISNYINNLTINDINTYSKQFSVNLDANEKKIVYDIIKHKWKILLSNNDIVVLNELKSKISLINYQKIEKLYYEFKDNYKNYL